MEKKIAEIEGETQITKLPFMNLLEEGCVRRQWKHLGFYVYSLSLPLTSEIPSTLPTQLLLFHLSQPLHKFCKILVNSQ